MGRSIRNVYVGAFVQLSKKLASEEYPFAKMIKIFPNKVLEEIAKDLRLTVTNLHKADSEELNSSIIHELFLKSYQGLEFESLNGMFIPKGFELTKSKVLYYEDGDQRIVFENDNLTFAIDSITELKEKFAWFLDLVNKEYGNNSAVIKYGVFYYTGEIG